MKQRQKSIRVNKSDRQALIALYCEHAIPIDQYDERRDELRELCDQWHALTGRQDAPTDVLHYMRTQRKNGRWVRLDGNHVKRPQHDEMSADDTELLVAIYREHASSIELGSDAIGYDDEIADLIAKEFSAEAGRVVPASILVATLVALRKRGLLPKIEKHVKDADEDIGFRDIGLA